MTNPLLAQRADSTTWHTGINALDDAAGVYDGIASGSWVEGGLSTAGAGLDALNMAMNPVGTGISYVLNWVIEHVQPLQDKLNQLAGDADQITAYANTWGNISTALAGAATDLANSVNSDTASWTGTAADNYRAAITDRINGIQAAAKCAGGISTAVRIVGVLTGAVRNLVRDVVTQAIGDIGEWAGEEFLSAGLLTPLVASQVTTQVAAWGSKIAGDIKKLLDSIEALRPLMTKLEQIWAEIQQVMTKLSGRAVDESHVSSAEEPHPTAEEPAANGGQQSDGNGGCDGKGGDPVDAVSGQMITSAVDVDLPGRLPLVLRRAYASGYRDGHAHGPGWASTVDQRVEFGPYGLRYFGDDAEMLHYSTGNTVPDFGARWPLSWDADSDTYRIADPVTGWVRHFAPSPGSPGRRPITALTDRNGNRIDFHRDERGIPLRVTSSGGYQVDVDSVDTDNGPRITGLTLRPEGGEPARLVEYRYDVFGRLTEIVDPVGRPYRYEYDSADRITAWVDRENYRYRYTYRADGRVARGEGDGDVLAADFAYDLDNRVTTVTDSLGHATTFHYDEFNHLTSVVDPLGGTESTVYDRHHELLSSTDPLGNTTRYTRDANGRPVRVDRPDGTAVTASYNELLLPTEVVGPDGARWRYHYDERGNLLRLIDPSGAETRYTYGPRGEPRTVTDPVGRTTTVSTDPAGLPVTITDPAGATETYQRNAAGRQVAVTDRLGAVTTTEWDATFRPVRRVHPDGTTQAWQWNGNGDLLAVTDDDGATTRYEIGPFHQVTARVDADGARHGFGHDTELRLTEVINPQGLVWHYTTNAAGYVTAEQDFNGRVIEYALDAAGLPVRITNGVGETTAITRDALGRVTEQRAADGARTTFDHDPAGRLVRATGADCELRFTRDPLGRILDETVDGRTLTTSYNAAGQRTARTTPTGQVSRWRYDPAGRPLSLDTEGQRITFAHDAAGRETQRWFGAGLAVTSAWDSVGQLTGRWLVSAAGQDGHRVTRREFGRTWAYRGDGLPVSTTDDTHGTRHYDLDPLGRVTAVRAATWRENYAYDSSGNLSFSADSRAADSPLAGPRVNTGTLLRRAGRTHFDYDPQGRLVRTVRHTLSGQRQTWTYRYDSQDRLTEAINPAGQHWRYRYDPLGRRIAKQRLDATGPVEEIRFSWDGDTIAEQEHRHANAPLAHTTTWDYRPGSQVPITQHRRAFAARAPQDVIDREFHAIITDLVGTPTELVSADGHVDWRRQAGLWGNEYRSGDPGQECLLRFPGQYHDYETGLDYNRHRYYDPETGRYTTPDPFGLPAAPNHHAYVDNPVALADPLGLISKDRYNYLDRPGYWNYQLVGEDGVPYYSGRGGPNETPESVAARHEANGDRFDPETDELVPMRGTRTYGQSRLVEESKIDKTFIGKGTGSQRGNLIRGIAPDKMAEYQEYANRKKRGLGCP